MLSGIRMEAVRATPLYRKMLAQKALPQLDDFARQTGFDPRRDVRELLIASNGNDVLMAARGTFNLRAIRGRPPRARTKATRFTRAKAALWD